MANGWVPVHRDLPECAAWGDEKFTKGQAWVDLLFLASYSKRTIYKRGVAIHLEPGQIAISEAELSVRWKWSRNKVRRFLGGLKTEQQIEQQKNNISSVITMLSRRWTLRKGQQNIQQKDSKRYIRKTAKPCELRVEEGSQGSNKETKKEKDIPQKCGEAKNRYKTKKGKFLSGELLTRFYQFWEAYDNKKGKAEAADEWLKIEPLNDETFNAILLAASRAAKERPSLEAKGLTAKYPQGWLSSRRWEDDPLATLSSEPEASCSTCKFQGTNVCETPGLPCANFTPGRLSHD